MDGSLWLRAAHRCAAGPAHSPMPYFGSEWGKLPAATGQEKISLETLITAGPKPKGKGQITAFGNKGLVYIFINFDDFTCDHYQNYRNQLINYSENQKFENLFIKIGLYGNRRIFLKERSLRPKTNP